MRPTWNTAYAIDAFLHERCIDRQTYERQRDKLREQLSLAEMELSDAVLDDLDVEGVLGFAEHVMTNAVRLWAELDIDGKQELQQAARVTKTNKSIAAT